MNKTMSIKAVVGFSTILTLVLVSVIVILLNRPSTALGSAMQGQEYQRFNFASSALYGASTTPGAYGPGLMRTGQGSLGTVVITGANTGSMNFYDATTSDITKRTENRATSTILLASIPASLVAGDYIYDVSFYTGLFMDFSGSLPTSTVTYR